MELALQRNVMLQQLLVLLFHFMLFVLFNDALSKV
jgi:hypothetical protein